MKQKVRIISLALLSVLLIVAMSCSGRFATYTSTGNKYPSLAANAEVDLKTNSESPYKKIGTLTLAHGSSEWQFKVAKKIARKKGADLLILIQSFTTTIITYNQYGPTGSRSWTTRIFLLGRYVE